MSFNGDALTQFAEQLSDQMEGRLVAGGLPPEEVEFNMGVLRQFNNIAVAQLSQEDGIELPGASQIIPWDEKTASQGVSLFAEGIYFTMVKIYEMGILDQTIRGTLFQKLAMDVFGQAKQVVASTYGQEHTPEFQLSYEQQVALMTQASENALLFYLNEFERENGPIEIALPPIAPQIVTPQAPPIPAPVQEEHQPVPVAAPAPARQPAPLQPVRPQGPTPHDKYGAVALLLKTLPSAQRAKILQNFSLEEKELITYYSYEQHIEQNLDLSCVIAHLKRFKETFKQGNVSLKSKAHQGLLRLTAEYPLEKLLLYVKDERPAIKSHLESFYHPQEQHPLARIVQKKHFSEALPNRIENILYQHLNRRLETSQR